MREMKHRGNYTREDQKKWVTIKQFKDTTRKKHQKLKPEDRGSQAEAKSPKLLTGNKLKFEI